MFRSALSCLAVAAILAGTAHAATVAVEVDKISVPEGRDIRLQARLTDDAGQPAPGRLMLPYVNGRRWGAHEYSDADGRAVFHMPLPNAGLARIQVLAHLMPSTDTGFAATYAAGMDYLLAGRLLPQPIPAGDALSDVVSVEVVRRAFAPRSPTESLVGLQWESWFTPHNAFWQTAQAVPVTGFYDSYNRDLMRQHILWFADLGIDFIMSDWSNHIWGAQHWVERPPSTNEIIHATGLMLETMADMKQEGVPVPKMVLMPGLSNGPPAAMTAVNEELQWAYDTWVKNPRLDGLWQDFDGKPLIVILDCGAVARKETTPVDESQWTVRWMSTQLQNSRHEQFGYWTWMDGSARPVVTYRDGKPEAVTPTPAYFNETGWTYTPNGGRRNGATYIESFKAALEARPRVVLLHQWNEFAGQPEGHGYGPNRDRYVDSYSAELSDDLEPVSLTAPGYRGDRGGWGYFYANLTRALIAMYRGETPDDTILTVAAPLRNAAVNGNSVHVEWNYVGKSPAGITIAVDGKIISENVQNNSFDVSLDNLAPGAHTITITATGATTRWPLSYTQFDDKTKEPIPAAVELPFHKSAG